MALHPQVAQLAIKLGEIEAILAEDDRSAWTEEIKRCRLAIENSDAWGADRFLMFFGGMGSLNDYYVERDGKPDIAETDKLHALLSEAWMLARSTRTD
jgi:hypothetical protein